MEAGELVDNAFPTLRRAQSTDNPIYSTGAMAREYSQGSPVTRGLVTPAGFTAIRAVDSIGWPDRALCDVRPVRRRLQGASRDLPGAVWDLVLSGSVNGMPALAALQQLPSSASAMVRSMERTEKCSSKTSPDLASTEKHGG